MEVGFEGVEVSKSRRTWSWSCEQFCIWTSASWWSWGGEGGEDWRGGSGQGQRWMHSRDALGRGQNPRDLALDGV